MPWRPSRWVVGTVWAFGPLGALSLLASDLPGPVAWTGAGAALVVAWRVARAEAARVPMTLAWPAAGAPTLDGIPLDRARLQWRGPLAFLQWRVGRRRHALSWWPDTLPHAARRELLLAAGSHADARGGRSVAP